MRIYPAIDIAGGKVVRLARGDFQKMTVYSERPDETAREWERQGAEWIHVVDLDGAKTGVLTNRESLVKIRKAVRCKIQFGGGVRDLKTLESLCAEGMDRVILGTKALDKSLFSAALEKFGGKIAASLDVRDGRVQTQGWLEEAGQTFKKVLSELNLFPLETLIYTDIQKDGMLEGPNFPGLSHVLTATKAHVILSGGVGSLSDIQKSAEIKNGNFEGVIVGRALYEKKFTLEQAIDAAKNT